MRDSSPSVNRIVVSAVVFAGGCASPIVPDGGTDAAVVCGSPSRGARIFATLSDARYTTGSLAVIGQSDLCTAAVIAPASGDSVLAWHQSLLVALNYDPEGDSVSYFDVSVAPPRLVRQSRVHVEGETGASDPRGYIAIDANRGYVTRWTRPSLAVMDLRSGGPVATIDLAPWRGRAPLPFPNDVIRVGAHAWVTLGRLFPDLQRPTEPGGVVLIDPATDTVVDADPSLEGVQAIELRHANPVGHPVVLGERVLLACVGTYFDATDGAVEEIDATTHRWVRDVVTEAQVRGNIDAVIALGGDRLLLRVISEARGSALEVEDSRLIEWSIAAQAPVRAPWLTVGSYTLTAPILARDGRVYVGDRGDEVTRRPAGIRVFDAADGREITPAPIPLGALLPYDLLE